MSLIASIFVSSDKTVTLAFIFTKLRRIFFLTPKSITTIFGMKSELLLNLASLNISIDKNEMYEFYYMNYKYTNLDDLIYNSYSQMTVDLDEKSQFSLDAYIYFIKKLSEEKNKEIKINIKKFIKSNKKNYYIKGPEN